MKSILIIINGFFPLDRGEDYLENELKYSKNFDTIYICPSNVYGNIICNKKYNLPNNSRILTLKKKYTSRIFSCLIFAIFHSFFWEELLKILSNNRKIGVFKFFIYSTIKSVNIYKEISKAFNDTDVRITLYSYWMADTAVAASLLRKYSNLHIVKCVTRCHRFDVYEYANKLNYLPYRSLILSSMDEIYPISVNAYQYLANKYGLKDKLNIERLGTEDCGFLSVSKSKSLRIVSCSWLRPVKRIHLIMEALKLLDIPIEWTHYGDGEEYQKLTKFAKTINKKNLMISFAGRVNNDEILKIYKDKKFDVFINVSENEGVPVSIMEAMSVGMVVIATDVGGTNEIVDDGINGYLLPKDCTPEMVADRIYNIYNMSQEQYAKARHSSRIIWESMCFSKNNYNKFYNDLLK